MAELGMSAARNRILRMILFFDVVVRASKPETLPLKN